MQIITDIYGMTACIKTVVCQDCGASFECKNTKRNANRRYCSHKCAITATGKKTKGRVHTEAFKQHLSTIMSGELNPFYGKKHTEETKTTIGIKNKWSEEDFNYCETSEKQKNILDGIMLADGHLDGSLNSARMTYGCKYKETLEMIIAEFPDWHFSEPWQSKKTKCYHFKSSYYKNMLAERHRWYQEDQKVVPPDVRITSDSCFWWFIGDGYQVDYGVMLCTDDFDAASIEVLIDKLSQENFPSHVVPSSNRIRIESEGATRFLDWILSNTTTPEQYAYKWGDHRKQRHVE